MLQGSGLRVMIDPDDDADCIDDVFDIVDPACSLRLSPSVLGGRCFL